MFLTQENIDRLVYMSRIAMYTNESNRAFHHAMIDAGWIPVVAEGRIMKWTVHNPNSSWDYNEAKEHYENGGDCTPTPF